MLQSPVESVGLPKNYWFCCSLIESSADSSTINVTYGSVITSFVFNSVVTFSGGNFSVNGGTVTTIDGGNIDAGSTITVGSASQVQLQGNNNRILITD